MAITVQWDNQEQTVIRWDFDPTWSWDELADSVRVSGAMIAGTDEDVDIILNTKDSQPPAGKITAYQRSAFTYTPSNVRMLILVCEPGYEALQMILPFFQQLEITETLDQARAALHLQVA